ncbi:antiterminator Q family protein [Xenorhabdus szentirmaii]|uniref:antiterminator Q family protein n=1 Tax=Xenorhabdus szentirmaii TaxID=290112 RepID=UPI0019C92D75|nr:hypothetical protein [Xenorhabdus sp. CUL]MBD2825492.1 hypothetical protein [Xenorhabdus sp. 5]
MRFYRVPCVGGIPKRAIGCKFKLRECEIRRRMLLAESFIFGCFGVLNKSLDLDLIYGFHSNYAKKNISTLSIPL